MRCWRCAPLTLAVVVLLGACVPTAAPAPPKPAAAPTAGPPAAAMAPTPTRPAELTTLKVTDLQITSSAGNYIGTAKGYFREEGIQLEFVRAPSTDLMPLLVAGQVDIGAGAIVAGLFNAFARGIPVKIVADHGSSLPNASAGGVVFRKDLWENGTIRGPADLRGRRIGVANISSAPSVTLDRYLNTGGLTVNDVEQVVLPFPDFLPAFENRHIDAAYFQEPFTTIAIERGAIVRGPIAGEIYPYQQIGVILFGERLLSDRALAMRYIRAYVRGVRDYVKAMQEREPAAYEEVVPILIEYTTVKDRALFDKAIPSGLKYDPLPNVQSLADDQEWFLAQGHQTQRINIHDFVDTSFVEQAIRELGGAQR